MDPRPLRIVIGDLFVIAAVTLIGFATHDGLRSEAVGRMAVFFLSLSLAWLVVGSGFRVFTRDAGAGRVALAMTIAAPAGAVVRSLVLGSDVVPVFVLVITAVSVGSITVWRLGVRARSARTVDGRFDLAGRPGRP